MALRINIDAVTDGYTLEGNVFDGIPMSMYFNYNNYSDAWFLDLLSVDEASNIDIKGIKLVESGNLLAPHGLDDKLGALVLVDFTLNRTEATRTNFGDTHKLYYITKDEIDEATS